MSASARRYGTHAILLLVLLGSAPVPASEPQTANPRALAIKRLILLDSVPNLVVDLIDNAVPRQLP
jgi:hypothetical protein